mgnify:CR=1 FL=1
MFFRSMKKAYYMSVFVLLYGCMYVYNIMVSILIAIGDT